MDNYARTLRRDRIYFADSEDDIAVFATYPVITQQQIAGKKGTGPLAAPGIQRAATRKSPTIAPGGVGDAFDQRARQR